MHFDRDEFIRLMDRHFFTYADMAERVGVSLNTVYRWAAGRMEPSKKSVRKLAEVFGVDPMRLMAEDEGIPLQPSKHKSMRGW